MWRRALLSSRSFRRQSTRAQASRNAPLPQKAKSFPPFAHRGQKEVELARRLSEPEREKAVTVRASSAKDPPAHLSLERGIEASQEEQNGGPRAGLDEAKARIFAEKQDLRWPQTHENRRGIAVDPRPAALLS